MRNTIYDIRDTIVAVSSPASGEKAIVRISGPKTVDICRQIFSPPVSKGKSSLIAGSVAIDAELRVEAKLYLFLAPHSYTGDDVAEIHIHTNPSVTAALIGNLLRSGFRMAGPGEFTARAYLNGKIDLAQAEAVNEIIVGSNKFQLSAAEKLLAGRLAEMTAQIRSALMDSLSLIEARLDFSGEDIEFITRPEAARRLAQIRNELEQLLCGRYRDESVIDLPAVGIAGAPNAGKSSLLNKLLGKERSIVSGERKTTRDVLTGLLTLRHCRCVLFDCAGLTLTVRNILDELAQQAAIEALRNSSVVVFCIDISKTDYSEDITIRKLIEEPREAGTQPNPGALRLISVAAKSDSLTEDMVTSRLAELNELFDAEFIPPIGGAGFIPTSAKTGRGVEELRGAIDKKIIELALGPAESAESTKVPFSDTLQTGGLALTARHRQAVTEAIENISESIGELKAGNDEVTAMMLRATYQAISNIEQETIDEQILERIFSRFCVGK
jgi:tRNA modification GTPase